MNEQQDQTRAQQDQQMEQARQRAAKRLADEKARADEGAESLFAQRDRYSF